MTSSGWWGGGVAGSDVLGMGVTLGWSQSRGGAESVEGKYKGRSQWRGGRRRSQWWRGAVGVAGMGGSVGCDWLVGGLRLGLGGGGEGGVFGGCGWRWGLLTVIEG